MSRARAVGSLFMILVLAGCASQASPSASSAPAASPGASIACSQVSLFGAQGLTGANSAPGLRGQAGSEIAVKEINDAGGFEDSAGHCYTLTLSRNDFADSRDDAVALFRQAAADTTILAQIGPTSSLGFVPVEAIAEQLKLPVISDGSVASIATWNAWSFRVNSVNATALPPALKSVHDKIKFARVSIIYDKTNDGQVSADKITKDLGATLGYSVVSEAGFDPTEQDFSVYISNMKAAKPDLICIFSASGAGSKVSLQIANAGVTAPQFTPDGVGLDTVWWDNSKGATMNGYTYFGYDLQATSGPTKKFIDTFAAAYPSLTLASHALWGYDAIYTLVAAIKQAGSADRAAVQKALSTLDTTTPLGSHISFKNPPNGDNLTPAIVTVLITGRGTYTTIP